MGQIDTTEFDPHRFFSSGFRIARAVLLSPGPFFDGMDRKGGWGRPFLFMAACVAIHTLFAGLGHRNPVFALRNLGLGLGFPFLTAGILFLILSRMFRAPGTYEEAFRVVAYASAVNLCSWLPMAGLVLELYRLYLMTVGLARVFQVRVSRSAVAIALTIAAYVVLAGAVSHLFR